MQIRSESRIHHPVDKVFGVYRDHMADVAAYIPDVKEILVLSREDDGDKTTLHNQWSSETEVPAVAAKFIKPEHLCWDDFATWNATTRVCEWQIKTRVFTEEFRCSGRTELVGEGDSTLIRLSGTLVVDLSGGIKGVPGFVAKRLAPQIEKFIVSMITPNLEKTNVAIGAYLDAQG